MKKQNLKKLRLKKTAISKLEQGDIKGGTLSVYTRQTIPLEECYATVLHTMCNGRPFCVVI